MKILCFGAGKLFTQFVKLYNKEHQVIGVLDNNEKMWGEKVVGFPVLSPQNLNQYEYDSIVITSVYGNQIREQLCGLNVKEETIFDFSKIISVREDGIQDWGNLLDIQSLYSLFPQVKHLEEELVIAKEYSQRALFLSARSFIQNMPKQIQSLEDVEFQVFSQFGEDGIIQWLIKNVDIKNKTFIEFGVENYDESNTRFLLMNNNWSGFIMDGSKENMDYVKNSDYYWKFDLIAKDAFVTKENINQLLTQSGFTGEVGLLNVDVDGNDYWILDNIDCVNPQILICEYNAIFGDEKQVTIPYDEAFYRTSAHYSNLYWGASLGAFKAWAEKKGYYFVGTNSTGHNAFFVRKDSISKELVDGINKEFRDSKYRESKDKNGKLTFLRGKERLMEIKEMPLVDLVTGKQEKISKLYELED